MTLLVNGQSIKGVILNKETRKPVSFAAVYYDGTSIATYTDEEGKFALPTLSDQNMPLTVSALGYSSTKIDNYSSGKSLLVYLEARIFEIEDITIKAARGPDNRKEYLEIFRRELLGRTKNAEKCEIINEVDIRFVTSSDNDTLIAFSVKPLQIINRALGYKITYFLQEFEFVRSMYFHRYVGSAIFEEDADSVFKNQNFTDKRYNTYLGSQMHFFRSLWLNELESNGFEITVFKGKGNLSYNELVKNEFSPDPDKKRKYIFYSGTVPAAISIRWIPGKSRSNIELLKNRIYFEKNGYYKGGIIWQGQLAQSGIADLLPFDYQPSLEFKNQNYANSELIDTVSPETTGQSKPIEKVYLHTDRDYYNQGDSLWFQAYLVDGWDHNPTDNSGNLHVELISPGAEVVGYKVIKLDNGLGNGDFIIPVNLNSGIYILRAYTNYMRNYADPQFFHKEISIISSEDKASSLFESSPDDGLEFDIGFYPESGSLICNVGSKVAFKALKSSGEGCDVHGEIFSEAGNLICTFKSTHLGMGTFCLTPLPGRTYYATVINSMGDTIIRKLPEAFEKGFTLSTRINNLNQDIISIRTNKETLKNYTDRKLLVTVSSHGKVLHSQPFKVRSESDSLKLPLHSLPDGIVSITLYYPFDKPLCERLIFIENGDIPEMNLITDKSIYKQRDSVKIGLSVQSDADEEVYLSLSVTDSIFRHSPSQFTTNISSWFLLESDIRGQVENPSYYFDYSNPDRLFDLDLLLLTQGWRDFEWKHNEIMYQAENGFTFSGKLYKPLQNLPVRHVAIDIGIFQNNKNSFSSVNTDSAGRFHLDIESLYGKANVVATVLADRNKSKGRLILDTLSYMSPEIRYMANKKSSPASIKFRTENLDYLIEADMVKKEIRRKYTLRDTIPLGEVTITGKRKETPQQAFVNLSRTLYGQPDKEVIVRPNESAGNVRDLLMGKVSGLMFVGQGSGIRIRGAGSSMLVSDSDPLFLLDGMVVSYGQVYAIPIEWIDRVDVIKTEKTSAFGVRGANGVISVITKQYTEAGYKPVSYSANTIITGFDTPRVFYSPKYGLQSQTNVPDIRSTLYWHPDIKLNSNQDYMVEFFNSDVSSSFQITVEGITASGIPISKTVNYQVK